MGNSTWSLDQARMQWLTDAANADSWPASATSTASAVGMHVPPPRFGPKVALTVLTEGVRPWREPLIGIATDLIGLRDRFLVLAGTDRLQRRVHDGDRWEHAAAAGLPGYLAHRLLQPPTVPRPMVVA